MTSTYELSPEQLRRIVDPRTLDLQTTEHLTPIAEVIGQQRAVAALQFGLGIRDGGFNIYVAGPPGSGKMTAVQSFIEEQARQRPTPPDWCYVNNFDDTYQPKVFKLPAGRGRQLQQDMRALIEYIGREIPRALESDDYTAHRDEITKELHKQREELLERFGERVSEEKFAMQVTPMGVMLFPITDGHPLSEAEFQALPEATRTDLMHRNEQLQEQLKAIMKESRARERDAQERLQALDQQVALYTIGGRVEDMEEQYREFSEICAYLAAVQKDILENIDLFKRGAQEAAAAEDIPAAASLLKEMAFRKYQVNVLVDNSRQSGAPVVVELNPSYTSLFGRIEKESQFGALSTDFTLLKAGALHRANGGYLVIPVEDLLRNAYSWEGIKRALHSREILIEELSERLGFVVTRSLSPQPIPLDVKVILVGSAQIYHLLHALDEMFPELFKVKADFDTSMERSDANQAAFVGFLAAFCEKEQLRHMEAEAVALAIEQSSRMAEDQTRLSTIFGVQADLIREANFWAGQEGAAYIGAAHMRRALDEKIYRASLIQERLQELIAQGTLLIDTAGRRVGEVNGLAVLSLSDYMFGKPGRISASVGPGREGIVDVEREVKLGGPLHSKGMLILSGYLTQRYAQERPLTLQARLVFEQSYEEIDGDSASSAELYALLSALSGLPIDQGIAVTGSVNQHGEVQAIGGVNQKIEGFFDACKAVGLTGRQGVLIPRSNVRHLMLREDVVAAVRDGQFHVWAVATIDEGIAILTGAVAGAHGPAGWLPAGSVNDLVDRRLSGYTERLRELASPAEHKGLGLVLNGH